MTELLRSAAPVFTVGGDVKAELARDLTRLEIEETTAGLKTLCARFLAIGPRGSAEEDLLYLDGQIFDFGKTLDVSIGPDPDARTVFKGLISGIEAAFTEGAEPEVIVFAEDTLMKLRMTRRMKTYRDKSDAQIAEAIAGEHGIAAETAADGPTYEVVQQWNQSDLAFLRARARLIQAEIWLRDDTLHFASRGNRSAPAVSLVRTKDLVDLQVRADLSHQRTSVRVSGFDAQQRDQIDEEAGADAIQAEATGGRTGPAVLQQAFGERVSYRVREVPLVSGEARAWARAEMLRRSRAFVSVVGTTPGTADMVVGSPLTLEDVGGPFSGAGYYVTRVRHTYDQQRGFRTEFEAERATIGSGS